MSNDLINDQKVPDYRYEIAIALASNTNFNNISSFYELNTNKLKHKLDYDHNNNEYEDNDDIKIRCPTFNDEYKENHNQNKKFLNDDLFNQTISMKRGCDDELITSRLFKRSKPIVTVRELREFFNLLEKDVIKQFLQHDGCYMVTDKYALAMVFTYFKRAKFDLSDYTKTNFFLALYLANDIEEDIDEYKYEILPWALGNRWRYKFLSFLKKRDILLRLIDYRAIVSRKCCEEVMSLMPEHNAWKRTRSFDHGGATRSYQIRKIDIENGCENYMENDILLPRGPDRTPRLCPLCTINNKENINFNEKP